MVTTDFKSALGAPAAPYALATPTVTRTVRARLRPQPYCPDTDLPYGVLYMAPGNRPQCAYLEHWLRARKIPADYRQGRDGSRLYRVQLSPWLLPFPKHSAADLGKGVRVADNQRLALHRESPLLIGLTYRPEDWVVVYSATGASPFVDD